MTLYKKLKAWKHAMELATLAYKLCDHLPATEKFILRSQIVRASVSVPSNIAEGMGRLGKNETLHFLHIARGSLYELETLIELAYRQQYLTEIGKQTIEQCMTETLKILNGLIKFYRQPPPV